MKKVLYLGNKLSRHGYTPTSIETIGERLKEFADVEQVSEYRTYVLRLCHMWARVLFSKASIVIIDTYSTTAFHYAWTSALLCKLRRKEYVAVIHGGGFHERVKDSPSLVKKYLQSASRVVVVSGFIQRALAQFKITNILLISNYIDIENYTFNGAPTTSAIKLLWVRSFHSIYRPERVIQVLAELHKRGYSNASLCMIGPDKDGSQSSVEQLVQDSNLSDFVLFTGKLSKKEWTERAKGYNLFISTTSVDNNPVSVMEAMALGLPVISSNVGGMPYLIEHLKDGVLVEENAIDEYVDHIIELHENRELFNRIAQAARMKAESCDWTMVKNSWREVLMIDQP